MGRSLPALASLVLVGAAAADELVFTGYTAISSSNHPQSSDSAVSWEAEIDGSWTTRKPVFDVAPQGSKVSSSITIPDGAWPTRIRLHATGDDAWGYFRLELAVPGRITRVLKNRETSTCRTADYGKNSWWVDGNEGARRTQTFTVPDVDATTSPPPDCVVTFAPSASPSERGPLEVRQLNERLESLDITESTVYWITGAAQTAVMKFPTSGAPLTGGAARLFNRKSLYPANDALEIICHAAVCDVQIFIWFKPPHSSNTNGNFPLILPDADWTPSSRAPSFSIGECAYPMTAFRRQVLGGQNADVTVVPETNVLYMAIVGGQGRDCSLATVETCELDDPQVISYCKWTGTECVDTWAVVKPTNPTQPAPQPAPQSSEPTNPQPAPGPPSAPCPLVPVSVSESVSQP